MGNTNCAAETLASARTIGRLLGVQLGLHLGEVGYAGEDDRMPGGERVRVDELDVLRMVWAEYDEWDDDYEWQVGSEGVVVELDKHENGCPNFTGSLLKKL